MVTYKEKDKDLVIPASLGNFKTNGGGGGVTPEEVQIMINTSIAGYDATVQEEFNTTNSGVSENAQNIETLSGKTQEIESALENYATTAQTSEIASGLTELSGVTEQLSQTVGDKANASDLEALSGVTGQALQNIGTLSAQTSGLSAQIEAVSGAIPTVEVEQVLSAGTKIATVSVDGVGTDLYAPEGGPETYVLNLMSQQERATLYTELVQYKTSNNEVSSGFPVEDYQFYVFSTNSSNYKGFVPVELSVFSPDYGGSIFFTGLVADRNNYADIIKVRYIVTSDGGTDQSYKTINTEVEINALNYSWTGKLKYDIDNNQFLRGNTVLVPSSNNDNFERASRIDELINKIIAIDTGASNRMLTPVLPFGIVSGGTEYTYTEPTIDGKDITPVTIDGQTYSRQYSFIYTKEDGSRFVIKMLLNNNQKATGFEYTYIANGGSQGGPTVIDFDAMTQQEIATFIGELEPVWSGTSVNGEYVFLKTFRDYTPGNQGTRQMRVQFIRFQSNRAYFSTLTLNPSDENQAIVWKLEVNSDGTCSTNTPKINSQTKGTDVVGYFDDYKRTVEFNKSTSAFTYNNGTALVDGQNFGGSFYWFIVDAVAGDWGQAIPILRFKVIENGSETTYQYPSASIKDTSVTIDDVEYTKECKFDYGKFTFGMLCNANPKCANFTFTENY